MQREHSDSESEERRLTPPREGQSKKKRYNVNNKIFVCPHPCGKDYSTYQSLDQHVKTIHKDDLKEIRNKIKRTLD